MSSWSNDLLIIENEIEKAKIMILILIKKYIIIYIFVLNQLRAMQSWGTSHPYLVVYDQTNL